ncbi:hypothetical protein MMC25_002085 [Agyrium rufum]|nr:hypothetical protein [Agyrium rufum]
MASRTPHGVNGLPSNKTVNGQISPSKEARVTITPRNARRDPSLARSTQDAGLKDYQLGDCVGKGAFGSVYRALNMQTGETVAVKQIKLANLPKSELRVITLEIDLLKNLDHPNIVKYHGFVKSAESLNIILEYCENGSLHSISKNFGKFPENLVGMYMSQVLHGLLYLHEQGVIHRDIKGANILTTKQGLVKLADFGVATRTSSLEASVVGTPYWMAPEIIELSGASPASDIWSLGCTVIELLDGKPPYHKLQPMHALFRIVNDDHPPLPEGSSSVVRDFLTLCFQKDPNLRVSARKLLKHQWIVSARRSDAVVPKKPTEYEEAVKSVQEWNEALRSPNSGSIRRGYRQMAGSPIPGRREIQSITADRSSSDSSTSHLLSDDADDNDWDKDFAPDATPNVLQLPPHLRPQDHFGGMLSAEKLKAYASISTVSEEKHVDADEDENECTVRSPAQLKPRDPLATIRPYPKPGNIIQTNGQATSRPAKRKSEAPKTKSAVAAKPIIRASQPPQVVENPKILLEKYRETDEIEEFISDLSFEYDGAFEKPIQHARKPPSPIQRRPERRTPPRTSKPIKATGIGGSLRRQPSLQINPSMRRTRSSIEIQRYQESEQDKDFSAFFTRAGTITEGPGSDQSSDAGTLMLSSRLSTKGVLAEEDEEEDDPFSAMEEGFDETNLEANVARDKYARILTQVQSTVALFKGWQMDDLLDEQSEQLLAIVSEFPETKKIIIESHGMLPMLEILENYRQRDTVLNLLRLINIMLYDDGWVQENLCFLGGVSVISQFTSKKYAKEIRTEAATFVNLMCHSTPLGLQMFVSAGGLRVLVEFLEEDYDDDRDIVMIGLNGVAIVFEQQGPTPRNDFCRILSRSSVLDPLSVVLSRVLDEQTDDTEPYEQMIVDIFYIFSLSENHVKELVAERTVLHRVLKDLRRMRPANQITMLKFIKNLSMLATTLDKLQNSNAVDVLTEMLRSSFSLTHWKEVQSQTLNTLYNLCRLSKPRQEDAALNGVIPILMRLLKQDRPLKEFALPILCDMAHAGKIGRRELWRNKGLQFYINLLADEYWAGTALDSIFIWLQEETAKVEDHLLQGGFASAVIKCLSAPGASGIEGSLEPLQKLLRLSPAVAASLAQPELFARIRQKLQSSKAIIRLNLLRVVRSVCDASEEQGALINAHSLYDAIQRLAESDPAILVRNMAGELIKSCDQYEKLVKSGGRRRPMRRTSSSLTPPSAIGSISMPPTPTSQRSNQTHYFAERENRPRREVNGLKPLRFGKDDGGPPSSPSSTSNGNSTIISSSSTPKSRLPRTTSAASGRSSRSSIAELSLSPRKEDTVDEDTIAPISTRSGNRASVAGGISSAPNSRRRRQTSGDARWT